MNSFSPVILACILAAKFYRRFMPDGFLRTLRAAGCPYSFFCLKGLPVFMEVKFAVRPCQFEWWVELTRFE
jgi:hypothetical protein